MSSIICSIQALSSRAAGVSFSVWVMSASRRCSPAWARKFWHGYAYRSGGEERYTAFVHAAAPNANGIAPPGQQVELAQLRPGDVVLLKSSRDAGLRHLGDRLAGEGT